MLGESMNLDEVHDFLGEKSPCVSSALQEADNFSSLQTNKQPSPHVVYSTDRSA